MIYTIGYKQNYEEYFNLYGILFKKGKKPDYIGGSVWKDYDSALKYTNGKDGYVVYGVIADWEKDTEPNEHGEYNHLLKDSMLVQL